MDTSSDDDKPFAPAISVGRGDSEAVETTMLHSSAQGHARKEWHLPLLKMEKVLLQLRVGVWKAVCEVVPDNTIIKFRIQLGRELHIRVLIVVEQEHERKRVNRWVLRRFVVVNSLSGHSLPLWP